MSKKPQIDDTERTLFRNTVGAIKPLSHSKIPPVVKPVIRKKRLPESPTEPLDTFSDYEQFDLVDSDTLLSFSRPSISHKILRNLRNGKYNAEAILDLHGHTSIAARQALNRFLLACKQQGTRHVLIIHGKGLSHHKPILKNKLNHWLRQTEQVLAFTSATARDGRGGALYVLLKVT